MNDFTIILGSKEELDFTLAEKDGHIIASHFSIRDSTIPGGSYLHSINDHPIHGSAGKFLQDVMHTIESPENYPLTLVFKSEADLRSRKKLTLPVPEDFLGDISPLTDAEITGYMELAKTWVPNLLEASKATAEGFKFVKSQDDVDIYIGTQQDKKNQLVRGSTKVKCTKDEMRAFMISHTTDSFRRLFKMIDVNFVDGLMLHQFPADYKHPDVPFYSIKWAIIGQPGPIWARDVCWLEYGDIITDEYGKEVGFGVGSSIKRPECPKMEHYHLIRADLMCTGYVFRPSEEEPGYMEVTYVMQADPKGWIPKWAVSMFAWQEALNLARIRKHAEGIHAAKERMSEHDRNGAAVQGVLILHGKHHTITVHAETRSQLTFGFCTASNDIGFHINGRFTNVEKWDKFARYHSQVAPLYGKVTLEKGEEYKLVFDNSYSWFRAKQVYYWFNVTSN